MKIATVGGGPGGLYAAICLKLRDPGRDVAVYERHRPDDTFGWGVVLSAETLANLRAADPPSAEAIRHACIYWDDVAVHRDGEVMLSTGHGFSGIGRIALLGILQERAREVGVQLHFGAPVSDVRALMAGHDLVIAADGVGSRSRDAFAAQLRPESQLGACRYIWLGTRQSFDDAFTFIFERTERGLVWAHAYQFDADQATFIVECQPETWRAWGFDTMPRDEAVAACQSIFAGHLGGHRLLANTAHSRGGEWLRFQRVLCERWSHDNLVLLGDAAATAHFSIGSGTKLAMESGVALADAFDAAVDLPSALHAYEDARHFEALRLQSAARNSMRWFEELDRYIDLEPVQFNYALLTRSQRIAHENLRLRDPAWLARAEAWFMRRAGGPEAPPARRPMFAPFRLRDLRLPNRIVVSPMAQYKAVDGCPNDWHLVHYGERAKGGAGLVFTEMTCVAADGRISPGCAGMYAPEHEAAWRRVVDFVHRETDAKICLQLGHAGAKGSTQLGWQESDAPLPDGNWPLLAASAVPWSPRNQVPRAMTEADMDRVLAQFSAAAEMAQRCGFDMLELHMAHGYLLSSFITPLTNRRTDQHGGSLDNRLRFPLAVFAGVRAVWPEHKPISVRISADDWVGDDGITPGDAVEIARRLRDAGVDVCDVSAGQTSTRAQPVYGRMFQTPLADRIRNEAAMPTMAVGNIYSPDHANSILLAGRADLVCLARPHLTDPYWTLHAAAALGDDAQAWPDPYLPGRDQLLRLAERSPGLFLPT